MNEETQFYTPLDRHLHVIRNLPGGFPAVVMVHMRKRDLDALWAARGKAEYENALRKITRRIQGEVTA